MKYFPYTELKDTRSGFGAGSRFSDVRNFSIRSAQTTSVAKFGK